LSTFSWLDFGLVPGCMVCQTVVGEENVYILTGGVGYV
jgi:hypothetical protein